jgi:hypothetical protein
MLGRYQITIHNLYNISDIVDRELRKRGDAIVVLTSSEICNFAKYYSDLFFLSEDSLHLKIEYPLIAEKTLYENYISGIPKELFCVISNTIAYANK